MYGSFACVGQEEEEEDAPELEEGDVIKKDKEVTAVQDEGWPQRHA